MTINKYDTALLGRNLELFRKVLNMTIESIAAALSMSRSSYIALVNGEKIASYEQVISIEKVTHISIDYLTRYDMREQVMYQLASASGISFDDNFIREYCRLSERGREIIDRRVSELKEMEQALFQSQEGQLYG